MPGRVNGFSLAYTAAGAVVLWSGIKGTTISDTFRGLLSGKAPDVTTEPIGAPPAHGTGKDTGTAPAGNTGASTAVAAKNQAIARLLAAPYGWAAGQQWADLVSLWNQESGWNNRAENPVSGAYGIAQALPPSKMPAAAQAPVSSATAQIAWGLGYIRGRYGSPSGAWAHEVADGWY